MLESQPSLLPEEIPAKAASASILEQPRGEGPTYRTGTDTQTPAKQRQEVLTEGTFIMYTAH